MFLRQKILFKAALDFFEDDDEFNDSYSLIKTFLFPVTVTTLDSLLFSFIPVGPYTQRMVNFNDALIIIDEVHCYDSQILGFFLQMIKKVKPLFNCKICIISATMPKILIDEFKSNLNIHEENIIIDKDSYLKSNYYFEPLEKAIFELEIIDSIIQDYKNGKKVIVRLNTIRKSIEFYRAIKQRIKVTEPTLLFNVENLLLSNSNFIVEDKIRKEEEVSLVSNSKKAEGFILIATSIIQISLDIDYDILYTELCPIDDLIQSSGRINRLGNKTKCPVRIFHDIKNYKPYQDRVLKLTSLVIKKKLNELSNPTMEDYNRMVDEVYTELPSTDLRVGQDLFDNYFNRMTKIKSKEENIKLRKESYASISVVPEECFEEKRLSKISVDIPLYLILRFPDFFKYDDSRKVIIAAIPYSSEEGLQFLDLNESMSVYFENII